MWLVRRTYVADALGRHGRKFGPYTVTITNALAVRTIEQVSFGDVYTCVADPAEGSTEPLPANVSVWDMAQA